MGWLSLLLPPIAMVIVLTLMGRPWWCGCGGSELWTIGSRHYSQHLFDPWTFSHFFHGGFFYGLFRGFMTQTSIAWALFLVLSVEAVWEIIENTPQVIWLYRSSGDRFYMGDSIANSTSDLGACFLGALTLLFLFYLSEKTKGP